MPVIFSILLAITTSSTHFQAFADEPSSNKEKNYNKTCDQLLANTLYSPPLYALLENLVFSETNNISTRAVDTLLSLKIYSGDQGLVFAKENVVNLKDLYRSLRITQRKFFEFKNTVFDTFVLKDLPLDIDNIELLQRDLEYWLDHLSEKYLRALMSSLNSYVYSSLNTSSTFEVTTFPYLASDPENLHWFKKNWALFSYYDQEWDLGVEFLTVAPSETPPEQNFFGKAGILDLEDLLNLVQETQIAMDNIKQISQFLAMYPEHIKNLDEKSKEELTEELFIMAGVSYERLGQILDKVLIPADPEKPLTRDSKN